MKRVFVNEQWRPGCHLCEYNCAFANSGLSDIVYEQVTDKSIKRLYYRDNRLVGYILIGDVARAGNNTAMIRNKTPTDTDKLELSDNAPSLIAFADENRGKPLGEVV